MRKLFAYSRHWNGSTLLSETPLSCGVDASITGTEIVYLKDIDLEGIRGLKREPDYDIKIEEEE